MQNPQVGKKPRYVPKAQRGGRNPPKEEKLISDFWLSVCGYTVLTLMFISAGLALRLALQVGHIGYSNRHMLYDYMGGHEEL
mmetsp:Transcript_40823/g.80595  ORF Transcript_40823/g.80595 Transcript_40823/m.80595 type:complete len:82 (-) Transcript_40823:180-425(-)|eukprot:CAMPEP_0172672646 /NCGR_PEP_ID=MMETSP1074-20121228/11675_1 /TAXON_ID=2916 /ORGANISM="Ceratium fusus, Strain PA161109" /LENGTH=81 /DNA_ID=CAMNT_0013489863 /DNA_START=40 /DNA_END=285 /DNA_ORIENTATION=+